MKFPILLPILVAASILKSNLAGQTATSSDVVINSKTKSTAMIEAVTATIQNTMAALSSQPVKMGEEIAQKQVPSAASADEKVPAEQLSCFADYLVQVKGAKTEIFAEKWFLSWRMKRAVVRQQNLKLRLYEREMAADIGKRRADECFTRNREVLHIQPVSNAQERKPVEFFVKIWELFERSANGRLQVSDGLNKKLEEQSECLVGFLKQNFGVQHLHEENLDEAEEKVSRQMVVKDADINSDFAVLDAHKVYWKVNTLLRWKWAAEEEGQKMPEIIFKKGTAQFIALEKCVKMAPLKWEDGTAEKSFLFLNSLLARFRDDQLFVREMPKTQNNFTIACLAMLKQHRCEICQNVFRVGNKLQQLYPCRHVFHRNCLEEWLDEHEDCPLCRARVTFNLRRRINPYIPPATETEQRVRTFMHAGRYGHW